MALPPGTERPVPRLFFALWPDDSVRAHLAAQCDGIAHEYRGRPMRADTLHMTLAFLGETPELRVPTVLACGDRVQAKAFTLNVDACSHFRKTKVAWLGCTESPEALRTLYDAVRVEVEQAGFNFHDREYHPHITAARDCMYFPSPCGVPAAEWTVESFVLIDSRMMRGGPPIYRVLKYWTLAI